MLCVSVLFPVALTILITHKVFCKNYGLAVNKPLWRSIIESFLGLIFSIFILLCQIYYSRHINKSYTMVIFFVVALMIGSIFIALEHIIPYKKRKKEEIKQKRNKNNTENDSSKFLKREDKNSLIERLGNKKTVDYIRAVLSNLSIGIFICYSVIVIILIIISIFIDIKDIHLLLSFWNSTLTVTSTLSGVSYLHTIILSIIFNDSLSSNESVDQVKKRLLD